MLIHLASKKDNLVNKLKDIEMNMPKPSLKVDLITNPLTRRHWQRSAAFPQVIEISIFCTLY